MLSFQDIFQMHNIQHWVYFGHFLGPVILQLYNVIDPPRKMKKHKGSFLIYKDEDFVKFFCLSAWLFGKDRYFCGT